MAGGAGCGLVCFFLFDLYKLRRCKTRGNINHQAEIHYRKGGVTVEAEAAEAVEYKVGERIDQQIEQRDIAGGVIYCRRGFVHVGFAFVKEINKHRDKPYDVVRTRGRKRSGRGADKIVKKTQDRKDNGGKRRKRVEAVFQLCVVMQSRNEELCGRKQGSRKNCVIEQRKRPYAVDNEHCYVKKRRADKRKRQNQRGGGHCTERSFELYRIARAVSVCAEREQESKRDRRNGEHGNLYIIGKIIGIFG